MLGDALLELDRLLLLLPPLLGILVKLYSRSSKYFYKFKGQSGFENLKGNFRI